MTSIVLDASVVVALYLNEPNSIEAERVLVMAKETESELYAPELLLIEVANALWKGVSAGRLNRDDAIGALDELSRLGALKLQPMDSLVTDALTLALEHELTAYDASYATLALSLGGVLISIDRKLISRAEQIGFTALAPSELTSDLLS